MEKKLLGMRIENKVNIGDVLTMLCLIGALSTFSFGMWRELYDITGQNDKRIVVVEQEVASIKDQATRDRRYIREDLRDIKNIVREFSNKLDKKVDK